MPVPSAIECVSGENKRNRPIKTEFNHFLHRVQCTRSAHLPERTSFYPGWGSGQYGPYGDPAGPGTPAQGEPVTPGRALLVGNPGPLVKNP